MSDPARRGFFSLPIVLFAFFTLSFYELFNFQEVLEEAKRVQVADISAWKKFEFQRKAHVEYLGEDGKVLDEELLVFKVKPLMEGFDEKLISFDGEEPTTREIEHHKKRARFSKSYNRMLQESHARGTYKERMGGLSFATLLNFSSYHYAGREMINDRDCYRLDFEPGRNGSETSIESKFSQAMSGSLWISAEGYHIVCAKAKTVKPISYVFNLAEISDLEMSIESSPVASRIWLPHRIEVKSTVRILWKTTRKRSLFTYSDFIPVDE